LVAKYEPPDEPGDSSELPPPEAVPGGEGLGLGASEASVEWAAELLFDALASLGSAAPRPMPAAAAVVLRHARVALPASMRPWSMALRLAAVLRASRRGEPLRDHAAEPSAAPVLLLLPARELSAVASLRMETPRPGREKDVMRRLGPPRRGAARRERAG
jgi:hypothetical protein